MSTQSDQQFCQSGEPSLLVTPEEMAAIVMSLDERIEELIKAGKLTEISIRGKRRYLRHEAQNPAVLERAA